MSAFKILTGKPTRKRPQGWLKQRWRGNIRIEFKETRIKMRKWIVSAQDRDYWRASVNAAMNLRDP